MIIRSLRNKLYGNLWLKIAIGGAAVMTLVVVVLGTLLLGNSQGAIKNAVLSNHKEIVARAASEITLLLDHAEGILHTASTMMGVLHDDPWRQETVLVALSLEQSVFSRVSLFDLSGKVLVRSDLGRMEAHENSREAIRIAASGKTHISSVRSREDDHLSHLTMAVPVKSKGTIRAVLIADINSRGLWEIVDRIRLGSTGRAFLISQEGVLLASPDKKRVLKNENMSRQKDIQGVLSRETGSMELRDAQGRRWVSSYAPIQSTGWGIVLRQEQDEAYLFSRIMRIQSWIIIVLSEIVAVLIAFFLARLFVGPIKRLLKRVRRASGSAQKAASGRDEIEELVGIFDNLTDALKKARQKERFSTVGEAAVWVAHELKNSLAPVKSFIQLVPSKHKDGTFIDKFRNVVPEEIKRCERMLRELSDFSSFAELKLTPVNVQETVQAVLCAMEEWLNENKVKIRFVAEPPDAYVRADAEKIKQLFINLVLNAISAMPGGGLLTVSVSLTAEEGHSYVEARISDTGIGIAGDRLATIFEPFHTTKKDGLGLGLAISRRIAEQHNGSIFVKSDPGKGTTFTVRLPTEQPSLSENIPDIAQTA